MYNEKLEILYQDEHFIAINKPNGLLVHPSKIARDATTSVLQLLRAQTGQYLYPIHRLDRKTSGVLLFAFDKATNQLLQQQLQAAETQKRYWAVIRGFFPNEIVVDYPLINDRGKKQEAFTTFRCVEQVEIAVPLGKFDTSRYSLIEAIPKTGRMHQIRKHCNHLRHPIIGDRPHGCNKQNRLFKQKWNMTTMLLHAHQLSLSLPQSHQNLEINAPVPNEFRRIMSILAFSTKI